MPNDLPPWAPVYQQTQRWLAAGVFAVIVQDLREVLRVAQELHAPSGGTRGNIWNTTGRGQLTGARSADLRDPLPGLEGYLLTYPLCMQKQQWRIILCVDIRFFIEQP